MGLVEEMKVSELKKILDSLDDNDKVLTTDDNYHFCEIQSYDIEDGSLVLNSYGIEFRDKVLRNNETVMELHDAMKLIAHGEMEALKDHEKTSMNKDAFVPFKKEEFKSVLEQLKRRQINI